MVLISNLKSAAKLLHQTAPTCQHLKKKLFLYYCRIFDDFFISICKDTTFFTYMQINGEKLAIFSLEEAPKAL